MSRAYLVDQRERSAVRQARANARLVRSVVRAPDPDLPRFLSSLETPASSKSLVHYNGRWIATSAAVGRDALPDKLRTLIVIDREPAKQRFVLGVEPALAVGIPIGSGDSYFEVFPLLELGRTLRTIEVALTAGSVVAFVGSVGLGAWASRRVLRPVTEIGTTAAAIASGRLDARLDAEGDAELVGLAAGFNAMVESLQERIERDARFSSNVSHELRSPLTTMKSALALMESRRDALDPRTQRALDLLADEVHRFERLVRDLLEISKFDASVADLELQSVNVGDIVDRALAASGTRDGTVVTVPHELHATADGRRLQQVLMNLVDNAKTHGGGVENIVASAVGDRVVIAVEDRGPGVAPEDADVIFDRFARATGSGKRASGDGLGLGLALVAEHVRLQRGRVWVEDRDGGGARFVVELPAAT